MVYGLEKLDMVDAAKYLGCSPRQVKHLVNGNKATGQPPKLRYSKIGSKKYILVTELKAYAESAERLGCEDSVQRVCGEKRERTEIPEGRSDGQMNDKTQNKYTYFIQSTLGGSIKIGCSKDPSARLKDLQTGNPEKLQILGVIHKNVETKIHEKFSHLKAIGEWYKPEPELVNFIETSCSKNLNKICLKLNKTTLKLNNKSEIGFDFAWDLDSEKDSFDLERKFEILNWWHNEEDGLCDDGEFVPYEYLDEEQLKQFKSQSESRSLENEYEASCELDVMRDLATDLYDCNHRLTTFKRVCINCEEGWICFFSKPINSLTKWNNIKVISEHALDMDGFTGAWEFFVIPDDLQIGISLLSVAKIWSYYCPDTDAYHNSSDHWKNQLNKCTFNLSVLETSTGDIINQNE